MFDFLLHSSSFLLGCKHADSLCFGDRESCSCHGLTESVSFAFLSFLSSSVLAF